MPIYEFTCFDCRGTFETLISTSQRDGSTCKFCGSERTIRKISLTAPAQVKSPMQSKSVSDGCGRPSCCGGGCEPPI